MHSTKLLPRDGSRGRSGRVWLNAQTPDAPVRIDGYDIGRVVTGPRARSQRMGYRPKPTVCPPASGSGKQL